MLGDKRRGGFTLLEIMIVLGIMALLLAVILPAMSARNTAKISSAAQTIRTLQQASSGWLSQGHTTYTGISIAVLQTANLLPAGFTAASDNPWGGSFAVAANTDSNKLNITVGSVPAAAGPSLINIFTPNAASTPTYDGDTDVFTVTF